MHAWPSEPHHSGSILATHPRTVKQGIGFIGEILTVFKGGTIIQGNYIETFGAG
jgi:hypothetical protein